MPKQRFELWRSNADAGDLFIPASLFDADCTRSLPADAKLIWTAEADSRNEAQQKRYNLMAWGHYRTIEEDVK